MDAQEWNKLMKNYSLLLEVNPEDIIPALFQDRTLTSKDKDIIRRAGSQSQQLDKFLECLKSKRAGSKTFSKLVDVLETGYKHVADAIKSTESGADTRIMSKPDPHLIDPEARTILVNSFNSKFGAEVPLQECRQALINENVFKGMNAWDNKTLQDFIKQTFLGAELVTKIKQGHRKKKILCIKNLQRSSPEASGTTSTMEDSSDESVTQTAGKVDMRNLNNKQLKEFLLPIFQKKHMPLDVLDRMESQYITGEILVSMSELDMDKEIHAPFGVRRLLTQLLKENSTCHEQIKSTCSEYLRDFDKQLEPTTKYVKGNCVDCVMNVKGKTTMPIRNFHVMQDQKNLEYIGQKVVLFVSACLNDRRNGTIYFGISPPGNDTFSAGEIVGLVVPKEEVQFEINDCLKRAFSERCQNTVKNTVRDARFVPVLDKQLYSSQTSFVIEVDVVPSSHLMEDHLICTRLKDFHQLSRKYKCYEGFFCFSENGCPKFLNVNEREVYDMDHKRIVEQRKADERKTLRISGLNLRTKLLNLVTGGKEQVEDEIFPFLLLSPVDPDSMDESFIKENLTFIKLWRQEVVFDFDPRGSTKGIYRHLDDERENVIALTTDNFDKQQQNKDEYETFTRELMNENKTSWMFCNGYEDMSVKELSALEWNQQRRSDFQNAFMFYMDNFGADRVIVTICLFSKNLEVMIEACDDILTKLTDWLVLAESEAVANIWQEKLLSRNRVDRQDLLDRCVVGMEWQHLNKTIVEATKRVDVFQVELPTSTGAFAEVREKKIKDWSDIELVSAGEPNLPENMAHKENLEKEKRERFYRGEQVDWLNFFFRDQVLKRYVHDDLKKFVINALEGRDKGDDNRVTSVILYHQPGAGGTTSAKHVLWELRKEYRCCVIRNITDQTCNQLQEFRSFSDKNPRPILILIDNEDYEKSHQLICSLEAQGRKLSRSGEEVIDVFCSILHCVRRPAIPKMITGSKMGLQQELRKHELQWFHKVHESLKSEFQKDKEKNVNPKFLVSFNILRENFKKDFVKKVVKEFLDGIKSESEMKLLKIVSFLNAFDPNFRAIPVSCFDNIVWKKQQGYSHGTHSITSHSKRPTKWDGSLSQGAKLLLNISSKNNRKTIRMFHQLIAKETLNCIKERFDQTESAVMKELLVHDIFDQKDKHMETLKTIVKNIVKQREYTATGKKEKFSSLILYMMKHEGPEVAVQILEEVFDLESGPQRAFIAQLIARFYIEIKNFTKAEDFANRATSILPTNSFLWDTHGQVFKTQLFNRVVEDKTQGVHFEDQEIKELVHLAQKCIRSFQHGQERSKTENTVVGENNLAGYFGELRAIILLLNGLKRSSHFPGDQEFHSYLVSNKVPEYLPFLSKEERDFVKHLEKNAKEAMRRLDEENLQMKNCMQNLDFVSSEVSNFDWNSVIGLKASLDNYFGETSDIFPKGLLTEQDKCHFRLRRAKMLGGTTLTNLLRLRDGQSKETLLKIFSLMRQNVEYNDSVFEYLRIMLDSLIVLLVDGFVPDSVKFEDVLIWTQNLYRSGRSTADSRAYLETFLYYALFNFPTDERKTYNLCLVHDLKNAFALWSEAFNKKYPKNDKEEFRWSRRETTIFFLGNGQPLKDTVHQDTLPMIDSSMTGKWKQKNVRDHLRLLKGILQYKGDKVRYTIETKEGNSYSLMIVTSHHVSDKSMWQKPVFFYLGFSFSGPKAFGIFLEEPSGAPDNGRCRKPFGLQPSETRSLEALQTRRVELHRLINSAPENELKQKWKEELSQISTEVNMLLGQ